MDMEADALERFGTAMREAYGTRLNGIHELDRQATELLVAVVLVGPVAGGDTLTGVDIAYDVVQATGVAVTPNVVSLADWLSSRQRWIESVEIRRLAVLHDCFAACWEYGSSLDHNVRILMREWATQVRHTREAERTPEPPRDVEEWRWRHATRLRVLRTARRHGVRLSTRILSALNAWARTKPVARPVAKEVRDA